MTIFPKHLTVRTTISRSRYLLPVAVLIGLATPVAGQDSTAANPLPEVHVVQEGETLWDLAAAYYGDPYFWPEIYRLNTMVVENPHWIFPGEELVFRPRDSVGVAVAPVDSQPSTTVETVERTPFAQGAPPPVAESSRFRPKPVQGGSMAVGVSVEESFRAVRPMDFYSAGFLTEGEDLPFGDVRGAPGSTRGRIVTATSAVIHQDVEIIAPRAGSYQIGDTLLVLDRRREISDWGNVMVPTGIAVVTNVSGRRTLARIQTQFELVLDRQVAMPIEPFRDPGNVRPTLIEDGVRANIIAVRDRHPVPSQSDVLFVDAGRNEGVTPGDVFEVYKATEPDGFADARDERVATLRIVHVSERSASGMLVQIYGPGVEVGAPVKLTRKMPT